jgi:hypothetical protein
MAVIPSFVLPACRNRKVAMSKRTNPVVNVDLWRISLRGKKLVRTTSHHSFRAVSPDEPVTPAFSNHRKAVAVYTSVLQSGKVPRGDSVTLE